MLRRIVTALILIPLVIVIVAFAVANRQAVTVSFDPFSATHPAYAVTLPLFAIVFVLLIVGVMIGGIAAWLRQSHWRRAARKLDAEVRALQREVAERRHQADVREEPRRPAADDPNQQFILPPQTP